MGIKNKKESCVEEINYFYTGFLYYRAVLCIFKQQIFI